MLLTLCALCRLFAASPRAQAAIETPEKLADLLAASYRRPVVAAPLVIRAPIIDGVVEREEWTAAASLAPFLRSDDGVAWEDRTTTFISYTTKAICVGFQFENSPDSEAETRADSQSVLDKASFELRVRPYGQPGITYHLRGIATGIQETKVSENSKVRTWKGLFQYAARPTNSGWEGEVQIPFESLSVGSPQPGEVWQISFVQRRDRAAARNMSWSYSSIADPSEGFGFLMFGGEGIAGRILKAGAVSRSDVGAVLELTNFTSQDRTAKVQMTLYRTKRDDQRYFKESAEKPNVTQPGQGTETNLGQYQPIKGEDLTVKVPARQIRRIPFTYDTTSGNYLLHYQMQEGQKVLTAGPLPFLLRAPLELILTPYVLAAGVVEVVADYLKLPDIQPNDRVVLELLDNENKTMQKATLRTDIEARRTIFDMPVKDLPSGKYNVRCVIRKADGSRGAFRETPLKLDPPPAWWDNPYGYPELTDTVPEPWTPMTEREDGFEVWNRKIVLGDGLQPKQLRNGTQDMFSRPVALDIGAGKISAEKPQVTSARKTGISYRQKLRGNKLEGELILNAEFDGFMKYSLRLVPKGATKLERLLLDIPLRSDLVTHYNHGSLGTPPSSRHIKVRKGDGRLAEDGLSLPFTHSIWVGTENLGIQWVAESDQWWAPQDPAKAVVVLRGGAETVLRINMVNRPLELAEPVLYEWAIIPTPVKPMNQEFLHGLRLAQSGLRLNRSLTGLDRDTEAYIDAIVEGGANAFCQWAWQNEESVWNTDFGAPGYRPSPLNESRKKALRQAIEVAHKAGIKWFIVYGIWSCYPDWPDVGSLWKEQALYPLVPSIDGYLYSPTKPFADWYIASLRKTIKELDIDGVYLDSSADPTPCANPRLGCGYLDEEGRMHATYPVFATRELHKRIYYLFHGEMKRGGLIYAHNSHYPFAAVESFVDVHHCGEGSTLNEDRIIPKFYGYPFGIPVSFTRWNNPKYPETRMNSWRFVLQVDSTIKAHPSVLISKSKMPSYKGSGRESHVSQGYDEKGEAVWGIWQAYKNFPWEGSRWIPNWRIDPIAGTGDPDLWVCMHLNPGRAALITVSSF